MSENVVKVHKCPICKKVFSDEKYVPFCSKRCADVDLGRWFNGSYAVPAEDLDEMETIELYEALEDGQNESEQSNGRFADRN